MKSQKLCLTNNDLAGPGGRLYCVCVHVLRLLYLFCIYAELYLWANQSVQPLDCLGMPDDTIHPIYVQHDLPQSWVTETHNKYRKMINQLLVYTQMAAVQHRGSSTAAINNSEKPLGITVSPLMLCFVMTKPQSVLKKLTYF